jgi:hypothetical protein
MEFIETGGSFLFCGALFVLIYISLKQFIVEVTTRLLEWAWDKLNHYSVIW